MTDSDIITRCPQCNTAFRVTSNQLAVADGVVRCGSCLAVFKAIDHKSVDDDNSSPQTEPAPVPAESTAQKSHFDDSALIKDEDEPKLDLEADIYDLDTDNKSKKTSLFDRKLQPISQHTRESADESWALDILADLEDDDIEPIVIKRNKQPEQPEPEQAIEIEEKPEPAPLPEAEPEEEPTEPSEEELAFSGDDSPIELSEPTVAEEHSEPKKKKKRFSLFKSKAVQSEAADELLEFEYNDEFSEEENTPLDLSEEQTSEANPAPQEEASNSGIEELYFNEDEYAEPAQTESKNKREPAYDSQDETLQHNPISDDEIDDAMHSHTSYASERSDYLSSIQPEPVEMEWYESERTQRWLWFIGATALSLTLILQFASFRFDSLSKHPSYRPYYETACQLIGCQLPDLIDTKKIRATNLVVRSHPSKANALIIDAILINNAGFKQPYPALKLEFSNLNGQIVASRDLQPSEYLRGELSGAKEMPANQPIQLSLPIIDPGEAAVNYQLKVIKAKP